MIKIFIGTDRSQRLALRVLTESIEANTKQAVSINSLENLKIPEPTDIRQSQRTGFSFARWAIPELCGYEGKAIYLDADMLVFSDIAKLWDTDLQSATIAIVDGSDPSHCSTGVKLNKNETSVMLMDCSKAQWRLQGLVDGLDGKYDYKQLMSELCFLEEASIKRCLSRTWNSMDYWQPDVDLLHYTNVPTQPWVSLDNPYGHIWIQYLKSMLDASKITMDEIKQEVKLGYIRPSLIIELTGNVAMADDPAYLNHLKSIDLAEKYVPHKEVEIWNQRRNKAIKEYESNLAKKSGLSKYLMHILKTKIREYL